MRNWYSLPYPLVHGWCDRQSRGKGRPVRRAAHAVSPPQRAAAADAAMSTEGPMSTPLHVLILEDSPADVELLLHELRRAGFEPRWQHVATERDFLGGVTPPPDIILADY